MHPTLKKQLDMQREWIQVHGSGKNNKSVKSTNDTSCIPSSSSKINSVRNSNDVEKLLSRKAPNSVRNYYSAKGKYNKSENNNNITENTADRHDFSGPSRELPQESTQEANGTGTFEVADTRLSLSGYSISKSVMSDQTMMGLKEELTARPIIPDLLGNAGNKNPPPKSTHPNTHVTCDNHHVSFPLWMESKNRFYMPKYFGLCRYGPPKTMNVSDGLDIPYVKFKGKLRTEQETPAKMFLDAANNERELGGILSLPCASGKTVMALYILAAIGKKTLIVVHKGFLLDQWKERIAEFLPSARVGLIKAQTLDVQDKDIVVGSLQSLSMKDYPNSVFQDFGFVIIDEVHRTGTEVFSRALKKVNIKRSMGLSATIHRKDGMTKVFTWYVGRVVFEGEQRRDKVHVLMCRFFDYDSHDAAVRYREQPTIGGISSEVPNISRMVNNICSHRPRTETICLFIMATVLGYNPLDPKLAGGSSSITTGDEYDRERKEGRKKRRVLVLSDRKTQLKHIAAIISEMNGIMHLDERENISTGLYIGDMKQCELEISSKKDVVLATYGFASEGFDVPGLDVLVLACPKSDIQQSVGRILRQREQDRLHVPLVVDIVDTFAGVFEGQARKRKSFYRENDFAITTMNSNKNCVYYSNDSSTRSSDSKDKGVSPEQFLGIVDEQDQEDRKAIYRGSCDSIIRAVNKYEKASAITTDKPHSNRSTPNSCFHRNRVKREEKEEKEKKDTSNMPAFAFLPLQE